MPHRNDAWLIAQAQENPKLFAKLYDKYHTEVYNYFWYRTNFSQEVAEDLMQETFFRAFRALPLYKIRQSTYLTYLLHIAHNLLVNYYRDNKNIAIEQIERIPIEYTAQLTSRVDMAIVFHDLQKIPPMQKEALLLKYREQRSVQEIAAIMNKSENAVKLLLSRGRKKIRKINTLSESIDIHNRKSHNQMKFKW